MSSCAESSRYFPRFFFNSVAVMDILLSLLPYGYYIIFVRICKYSRTDFDYLTDTRTLSQNPNPLTCIFPCFLDKLYPICRYGGMTIMKVMLHQILENKGISQNKMAKDTGISTATLRNLSHNRTTRISFDILEKICIYLDCGAEDILCVEK